MIDIYTDISSLDIGGTGDSLEVFCLFVFFPCFWRIKLLNNLENLFLTISSNVSYVWCLDIGRDDDDDYDDGESSNKDYYK